MAENQQYFSWQQGAEWLDKDTCLKFTNDEGTGPIRIHRIAVKSCACDSGGQRFWVYGASSTSDPCIGYGAKYTVFLRVFNPGSSVAEESSKATHDIPSIGSAASQTYLDGKLLDHHNMNTPGTSGSSTSTTASFGMPPFGTGNYHPYTGIQVPISYDFSESPIIQPGGYAYVHFRISNFKGNSYQTYIKFLLDPDQMEVDIDQGSDPYIWRMCEDHKWHLVKPIYVRSSSGWADPQGGAN